MLADRIRVALQKSGRMAEDSVSLLRNCGLHVNRSKDQLCRAAKVTQYSCDCYAYGLLAMGWADLVVEQKLSLYDAAAVVPIVSGAGGFISDWNGNPVDKDFDGHLVVASSIELAAEAVACFKG
ncbi:MAG: hypothetical protein KGJ13_07845 [Patescibacteria group bacterium]|nr:hypothetical protein [Patescibacteria group bacterium]